MRSWYPPSWSEQAREMCDKQVDYIDAGMTTIDNAFYLFSISYRAPIIRLRAAKRFARLLKQGKVKENYASAEKRKEILESYLELNGIFNWKGKWSNEETAND